MRVSGTQLPRKDGCRCFPFGSCISGYHPAHGKWGADFWRKKTARAYGCGCPLYESSADSMRRWIGVCQAGVTTVTPYCRHQQHGAKNRGKSGRASARLLRDFVSKQRAFLARSVHQNPHSKPVRSLFTALLMQWVFIAKNDLRLCHRKR